MYRSIIRFGSTCGSVKARIYRPPLGIRNMVTDTTQETATDGIHPKIARDYYLMGAILGGIGIGVPLYVMYLLSQYEVALSKRFHGEDDKKK